MKYFYLDPDLARVNPRDFKDAKTASDSDTYTTPAGIRGLDGVVEGDWTLPWSVETAVFRTSLLKVSPLVPPTREIL